MAPTTGLLNNADASISETEEEQDKPSCGKKCRKTIGQIVLFSCCAIIVLIVVLLIVQRLTVGSIFHHELDDFRSESFLEAEAVRRAVADKDGKLMTYYNLPNMRSLIAVGGANEMFPYMNFVQGFERPGLWQAIKRWFSPIGPKFKPPVKGETVGIVSYNDYAKEHFNKSFEGNLFDKYYTSDRIPSWEDDHMHRRGVTLLDKGMKLARAAGTDPMDKIRKLEPRFAFDMRALSKVGWDGFRYMGPNDIKYASNGIYGINVVEKLMEKYNTSGDVLGILVTDSVFSAHLTHNNFTNTFHIDLTDLQTYTPIDGYAKLGGTAQFVEDGGRLRTTKLTYGGKTYNNFDDPDAEQDFVKSKRSGWHMAESAIIASLLSMTNLVMHVKDLHLEIAAAFQAVTVDAFAGDPKHPVRRLLDPYISRSGQATNDNLKLLYEYHAADFSLAPLPSSEQLKLINDATKHKPLDLAEMDMERYGQVRNMAAKFSRRDSSDRSRWLWRWHYRALTVQRLYDQLIDCWLTAEELEDKIAEDPVMQAWWQSLIDHLPSLKLATKQHPEWASNKMTASSFKHVARTIMVWLSWIHEDVGHSAAAYVYNPVYTPMCVPEDGIDVPMPSWVFNTLAYRGFVFLHRAGLLDEPPDFWFNGNQETKKCFASFQEKLRKLGQEDPAFSECDKTGFYSCVDRVETAVSS